MRSKALKPDQREKAPKNRKIKAAAFDLLCSRFLIDNLPIRNRCKSFILSEISDSNRQKKGTFRESATCRPEAETDRSNRNCQELKTSLSPLLPVQVGLLIAIAGRFFRADDTNRRHNDGIHSGCAVQSRSASKLGGKNWWAWVDLNYRPHPYQGCALAT